MIDTLYVCGDSWTYGSELVAPEYEDDFVKANDPYRLEHSWGGQLGKMLNLPVINAATPGGSNDYIVRTTVRDVSLLLAEGKRPFVAIAWSQAHRFELWSNEVSDWEQYVSVDSAPKNSMGTRIWGSHSSDFSDLVRYYQQRILLDAFLKLKKLNYYSVNVFHDPLSIRTELIEDERIKVYLELLRSIPHDTYSFTDIVNAAPEVARGKHKHPLEQGHKRIAEHIFRHIQNYKALEVHGTI